MVRCNITPDIAACEATVPTERGIVQAVASATAGDIGYDAAAARRCVDAIRAHKCEGAYVLPFALRQTCDAVFTNRKGEGESCFDAAECEGLGSVCEGACTDMCCDGTCKIGSTAGLGAPCDSMPCSPDLACLPDAMSGMMTCQQRRGPGELCADAAHCTEGHGCDPNTSTCFKQAESGAPCNPNLAAQGCAATGDYCDATEQKCLPLPGPGEPCVTNATITQGCAPYALCTGTNATCALMPVTGEMCTTTYCQGYIRCENGTCGSLPPTVACTQ